MRQAAKASKLSSSHSSTHPVVILLVVPPSRVKLLITERVLVDLFDTFEPHSGLQYDVAAVGCQCASNQKGGENASRHRCHAIP